MLSTNKFLETDLVVNATIFDLEIDVETMVLNEGDGAADKGDDNAKKVGSDDKGGNIVVNSTPKEDKIAPFLHTFGMGRAYMENLTTFSHQ